MRHKTITLCPTTYEIARNKENFSDWVRNKLLEERPHAQFNSDRLKWSCYDCGLMRTYRKPPIKRPPCYECGKDMVVSE